MNTIIKNIDCLVTCRGSHKKVKEQMMDAGIIENGYIVVKENLIKHVGCGEGYKNFLEQDSLIIDGRGKTVTPGLIDSHTHVVYSGSRENELSLKLKGANYIDILKAGGGILSTVKKTREASFEKLLLETRRRLDLMLLHGTTTVESKSGYGLNFEDEIKSLKVNKELNKIHPIDIVSTYMGAHAVPEEYKDCRTEYIDFIIHKVIPYISENSMAEFIDCFCEEGVFSIEESRQILRAGINNGLKVKLHADEIKPIGGAELAAELNAVSAEHLVGASEQGMKALAEKGVVAVLLPATSFYLMLNKFAKARLMIDSGVPVALATDCNPGTSPTESLQTLMTFACFGMKLLPEEIINAMTINAACAINREEEIGSIEVGKKADIAMFNSINLDYLVYHFGTNAIHTVIKNGRVVVGNGILAEGCAF
ncbi:imidazolonepropionase [Clostridium swellfunianum]|uniref:imidazolonepropionase n=1 Tax=Clostridium swellfunianum TaxID=1367462 RepID=UPI0020304AE1|nr:imidazolonepropionase [Clostridium swellfunianum]MCM0650572.1 imidazolonepropionase [Clostridium swellfunianum]